MTDHGSVRWHRGGWEIAVQHQGRRVFRRVKAPNTRAGRRVAEKQLERLGAQLGLGVDGMTVAELVDAYALARRSDWSPSTAAAHQYHARAVVDAIGSIEVGALRPADLEALYGRWMAAEVAAATVRRRHAVLAAALAHAERWEVVAVSPARGVRLPKVTRQRHDDLPDLGVVLAAVGRLSHARLRVAARLAVATGARRGELVGLRWADVDIEAGEVSFLGAVAIDAGGRLVRKSTKGGRPKVLAVDEATVAVLVEWRKTETGPLVLGSPSDPSLPWHPERLSREWARHREGIGLAGLRFHDLRHLHATALLGAGVPVNTVADRLGHASARMTLDVYGHAIGAHDRLAADVIGAAGAKESRPPRT